MNVDFRPDEQHVLSLCSGGGGLDLGVGLAVPRLRTIAYVEIEAYACGVLVSRMEAGDLDAAPLFSDLRTFNSNRFRGCVDGVIGGYPCQPFSSAGKRLGENDPRHLWPVIREHLRVIQPRWCFFENVSNHLRIGFDSVARDLHGLDFRVAAGLFAAEEVKAPHRRERLFILCVRDMEHTEGFVQHPKQEELWSTVAGRPIIEAGSRRSSQSSAMADANDNGLESEWRSGVLNSERTTRRNDADRSSGSSVGYANDGGLNARCVYRSGETDEGRARRTTSGYRDAVGDADSARLEGRRVRGSERCNERAAWPPSSPFVDYPPKPDDIDRWREVLSRDSSLEPAVCRMADGLANRVDRLRLLGNGVVPEQAAYAFRTLATDLGLTELLT